MTPPKSKTTDTLIKHYEKVVDEEGNEEMVPVRYMSPEEIKERDALNVANTASAQRRRVLEQLAKTNGSGGHGSNGQPLSTT